MHCSTTHHRAIARRSPSAHRRLVTHGRFVEHRVEHHRATLLGTALIALASLSLIASAEASAQGRTITQFPYAQSFAFIPSGTSTTPNGPVGAAIFPTTDVDGGELLVDSTTSALMVSGSATGLNNNVGAGGAIRIQSSGSGLPTIAQGFIVHASFTGRTAGSISIDWSKVANGTSTRSNELRIAVSADNAPFSEIVAATFDNSATAQSGTLSTTLSPSLDGATSVRFRIYSINLSGSGGHPRVVVDNLRITADAESPLPVELADFEASYADGVVGLQWRTASEHDNEGFEVLRALGEDSLFAPIASYRSDEALRGLGTSPVGRSYHFSDELSPSLVNAGTTLLYRLADIAPDGSRTEHAIRAVRIEGVTQPAGPAGSLVRLRLSPPYPLPGGDELVARLSLAADELIALEIIDANGVRCRRVAAEPMARGAQERRLDIAGLASGMYLLVARAGDALRRQPFLIVR
jgi:hypothetical protein